MAYSIAAALEVMLVLEGYMLRNTVMVAVAASFFLKNCRHTFPHHHCILSLEFPGFVPVKHFPKSRLPDDEIHVKPRAQKSLV